MSFVDYARHRGVTPAAVTRAVQNGRIAAELDPASGRRVIDSETADAAWAANSDSSKAIGAAAAKQARAGDAEGAAAAPPDDDELGPGDASSAVAYSVSRAKREFFNAELARLALEERRGTLVDAGEVRKAAFEVARIVREAVLALPDRLAAELAGETDPAKVHLRLSDEVTKLLMDLTRDG